MANEQHFSGYMGADPETREVGETSVTEFRLADTESWKGKDGEKHERTTWIIVQVWGKIGEAIAKYKSKGSWIGVFGKYQVQEWEDKEGNKRYKSFLKARQQDAIEWGPKIDGKGGGSKGGDYGKSSEEPPPSMDDDIPF